MSTNVLAPKLDLNRLVGAILEKTKAGKLEWKATAKDDVFIVSVGGDTTIKVFLENVEIPGYAGLTRLEQLSGMTATDYSSLGIKREVRKLTLLDEQGNTLVDVGHDEVPAVAELFELARRNALNVDKRVQSLMEVLQKL